MHHHHPLPVSAYLITTTLIHSLIIPSLIPCRSTTRFMIQPATSQPIPHPPHNPRDKPKRRRMMIGPREVADAVVYSRVRVSRALGAELPNRPVSPVACVEVGYETGEGVAVG